MKGAILILQRCDLGRENKQAGSEITSNKHLQPGENTDSCWLTGEWSAIQETDNVLGLLSIARKGGCWENINT